MTSIYSFTVNDINGNAVSLESFKDQVLLIVNTASECGFTPQYEGLETLYQTYKNQGFSVLAFPCNQFGKQEPGDNASIAHFCQLNYQARFPLFEKIEVNGRNAHPLFVYLKNQAPGILGTKAIKWNFNKFLITRDGKVFKRYAPITPPRALEKDITDLLSE